MQPSDVFGLSPLGNFIINFVVNWLVILGNSIMYINQIFGPWSLGNLIRPVVCSMKLYYEYCFGFGHWSHWDLLYPVECSGNSNIYIIQILGTRSCGDLVCSVGSSRKLYQPGYFILQVRSQIILKVTGCLSVCLYVNF